MRLKYFLTAVCIGFATTTIMAQDGTNPQQPAVPAQKTSTQANNSAPQPWADHLRNATVSIGSIIADGDKEKFQAIGTGVLVAKPALNGNYVVIATARHVLDDPKTNYHPTELRIRFASEEGKPLTEDLGYVLPLLSPFGQKGWMASSDGSDLAIVPLPIALYKSSPPGLITDAIALAEFADDGEIYEGENLVILGFPGDVSVLMGPDALVRAVSRAGVVAWTNPLTRGGAFMIDSNILSGNSGGPVFKTPGGADKFGNFAIGGAPRFFGIVTSTVGNEYAESIGGLGKVEPASKLKQLLDIALPPF